MTARRAVAFDIETNGFLDNLTKVHSLVIRDAVTGELLASCAHHPKFHTMQQGLAILSEASALIGHNIIKFDLPALEKVFGWKPAADQKIVDTLVCTRLIWSDIADGDVRRVRMKRLPSKLLGSHKLEAWGYRLGEMKGEFDPGEDAWATWSEEMQVYCEQDVAVTVALWALIRKQKYSPRALRLEHDFAEIMAKQERFGFWFNEDAARSLYADLVAERLDLRQQLQVAFPPITVMEPFTPKRTVVSKGWFAGVTIHRPKVVTFNPGSRQMIADRLREKGWVPADFTPTGQAKIDETILLGLPYPEAKLLARYFLVEKRIGQIAEGDQAWLRLVRKGRIHGSVITNGAVTGRCTHSNPNIAQVPKVGSPWGLECRALFGATPGRVQVGADLAGLELRCLAHFMAQWDGGAYAKVLLEGDIHWVNVQALGLTQEDRDDTRKRHKLFRNGSKTFIYGFLYGAGDAKAGAIVFDIISALEVAGEDASDLRNKFFPSTPADTAPTEDALRAAGKKLKTQFLKRTPALSQLRKWVEEEAKGRGHLLGLDDRKLRVRSMHAALNTLLQSAGALIAKLATVLAYRNLSSAGYKWGKDFAFVAHVHDEVQVETREEIAENVGNIIVQSMREAGEQFDLLCPIDGEWKVGRTWADTH
ncbi:PolA DNA polymerase I - 3'-5' exonuclease and polymerase domains [uncultured Caudovirales phage]|uniref:PolA DNA polymerase I - 3'-5' exonuclease and polymerase domains n=1 Tax=uncultured Caudovirales phage TaxID=2100421 RepID=A0A6J5LZ13_9CAUD|nr:PolA DNA polymerase I - 3'-5' exonuclease and polymerase domains [uncultured Caudovirales phage]